MKNDNKMPEEIPTLKIDNEQKENNDKESPTEFQKQISGVILRKTDSGVINKNPEKTICDHLSEKINEKRKAMCLDYNDNSDSNDDWSDNDEKPE